jgi:DNA-binding XRE family transcriptional regulator
MLTPKELSVLLNITVHTYIAIEQEKFSLSEEIVVMLAKIYQIPTHLVCENNAFSQKEVVSSLAKFALCDGKERFRLALTNLIGETNDTHVIFKIRKAKKQIIEEITSTKTPLSG